MLQQGDTVAVCLSGGADSMSLFHFLATNQEKLGVKVIALHVNHGLREVSKEEEIFVTDYCRRMGAECIVYHADMNNRTKPQGLSTETWAREERYKFFFEQAEKYNAKLATAHTLSDKTETVLFNLTRGTGLKGAVGIPAVRDNIIRPLIDCTRQEIEQYCQANNIEYVTDQTNFEDIYSRNKIRLNVVPVLKSINPSFERSLSRFSQESSEIYTFLTQLSDNLYISAIGEKGLDISQLLKENPVVVKNLLRNYLDKIDCLSADNIEDIFSALFRDKYSRQLSDKYIYHIDNGYLSFERIAEKNKNDLQPVEITLNEKVIFAGKEYHFYVASAEDYRNIKEKYSNCLTYCANYDIINSTLILRTRQIGDKFTLPKRGVTKTVKKLFIEDKVPVNKRDMLPLLADEKGNVIWLSGYGVNKRYIPSANRDKVLIIIAQK